MSQNDTRDRPYAVGRGKPPKATQFKKGQSGNRKGRPRSARVDTWSLASMLVDELEARISIMEGGKQSKVAKIKLLLKTAVNKAIAGDVRLLTAVLKFHRDFDHLSSVRTSKRSEPELTEEYFATLSTQQLSDLYLRMIGEDRIAARPGAQENS